MHEKAAYDLNHMTDPLLGICLSVLTKEISHAPIVLERGPCWCCARRHDRLRGCANASRTNAAGADAARADDGDDAADEPDDGSLQRHDAGWPAPAQGRARRAGKEGLNLAIAAPGSVLSRFELRRENRHESALGFGFARVRHASRLFAGPITTTLYRPRGTIDQGVVRTTNRRLAGGPRHGPGACGRAQRISRPDACARTGRCPRSIQPAACENAGAIH